MGRVRRFLGGAALLLLLSLAGTSVWAREEPMQIRNLKQTSAGLDSITLQWAQEGEAEYYKIYQTLSGRGNWKMAKTVLAPREEKVTTAVYLPGKAADKRYDLKVVPYGEDGKAMEAAQLKKCRTIPDAIDGLIQRSDRGKNRMKLYWNKKTVADGYQVLAYNCKTHIQKSYLAAREYTGVPMADRSFYRVMIRPYIKLAGVSKAFYGPYYSFYTAQQMPVSFAWVSSSKVKASWKSVSGATSYTVYLSRNRASGYKKVKTVRGTSYIIPNLKNNTGYYVYVTANKTSNKLTWRSPRTYTYPFRIRGN